MKDRPKPTGKTPQAAPADNLLISRRRFLGVSLATALIAYGTLTGCSSSTDAAGFDLETGTRQGFASDTEVKNYPVKLKIYAPSYMQYYIGTRDDTMLKLEEYSEHYRMQNYRGDVTFEFVFLSQAEMLDAMQNGFGDGDGVIAIGDIISVGCSAETVDGGAGEYMVRNGVFGSVEIEMVRAIGSEAMLPKAVTLDGEDSSDGTINRLQRLPDFDGLVALADPAQAIEGVLANTALARQNFYADYEDALFPGAGGYYDESIASKLRMYPNQDSAMAAIANGECQLGFAISKTMSLQYPEMEICYELPGGDPSHSASALICADEPGVARDFFEAINNVSW